MTSTGSTRRARSGRGKRIAGLWRSVGWERIVGFCLLAVLLGLRAWDPTPVKVLRLKTFDVYQQIAPREPKGHPVAIVDIDERSLAELGQWPWPRTMMADLLVRIFQAGAVTAALDVLYPEADRLSPARVADLLGGMDEAAVAALRALPDNDVILADILRQAPVVLARTLTGQERPAPEKLERPSVATVGGDPRPFLGTAPYIVVNLPLLEAAANGHGLITTAPDADGTVRRVPMVMRLGKDILPSLSLESLRLATGQKSLAVRLNRDIGGIEGVVLARQLIPTDEQGWLWIRFTPHDPARFVSALDVMRDTQPKDALAGKIVLIGTSSAGLLDIKTTPLDAVVPGVELHAQAIETIMEQAFLHRPEQLAGFWETAVFALTGLLLVALVPVMRARWTLLIVVVQAAALFGAAWYLFAGEGVLVDPVYPSIATFLVFSFLTYANFSREERQRQEIRGAFSRYVSPDLVERLAAHPDQLRLGGEMRYMSVLFSDIRGFTSISETLDAQGLTSLINRFLTPMTDIILSHKGTIDKYMGDAIMALWNAPLDDEKHALNACRAALAMSANLGPLNEALSAEAAAEGRRYIPLNVGIGIQSGECCVGNMGSTQRFDYSVLGDSVNQASRLEGQTKNYGVTCIFGESTHADARELASLEADLIRVKGKKEPVRIFALLGDELIAGEAGFARLAEAHAAMIVAYRNQDWDGAAAKLAEGRPFAERYAAGGLYDLYAARIAAFRAEPPGAGWDGVYTAESK